MKTKEKEKAPASEAGAKSRMKDDLKFEDMVILANG